MSQANHTVLVVDDEPAIAETVEYSLKSEGFAVLLAETGNEALNLFREKTPSLIVLDVGLPDISGFDVCRQIRKTSDVPILFLTARESEIDRVVGLELGGDDYVVKPFSPRELTARIKAILRRSEGRIRPLKRETQGLLAYGRLRVDSLKFQAELDGADLGLSRYEFGLIKAFLEHPGRVYSRDQLMEMVWDEPDTALDRTVDAHIKTLRGKMRAVLPDFDPIVTHRGIGYSLLEEVGT